MRARSQLRSDVGRWGMVPEWLLDSTVSDRALRLYALLGAKYADRGTNAARLRRKALAAAARISLKTLDRALAELESLGALVVHRRRRGDGLNESSTYTLRYARPKGVASNLTLPRTPTGGVKSVPRGGVKSDAHYQRGYARDIQTRAHARAMDGSQQLAGTTTGLRPMRIMVPRALRALADDMEATS